jgi:hypothetical protein
MIVQHLPPADLQRIGDIDRSEDVALAYAVESGELVSRSVDWSIPNWSPSGAGDHSVQHLIETWGPVLDRGATLLGAFDGAELAGIAIVEPGFEPGMAWLALLHVGRSHRRLGAATALWNEAERLATAANAGSMYISSNSTESAVGFYLSKDCVLASSPHPDLFAREPDDIHLIRTL